MVLEVQTDTRKVDNRLDTNGTQLLGVTDTRALKDERRRKGTARDDDLSPGLEHTVLWRATSWLRRHCLYTNSAAILDDDLVNLCVASQVQVGVHSTSGVDVPVSTVTSATSVSVDPLEPMLSSVPSDEILQVIYDRNALGFGSPEEIVLDWVGVVTKRHLDGTLISVNVLVVRGTLVRLMLLHEWQQLLCRPALGLEVIVVRSRGSSVHHEVD